MKVAKPPSKGERLANIRLRTGIERVGGSDPDRPESTRASARCRDLSRRILGVHVAVLAPCVSGSMHIVPDTPKSDHVRWAQQLQRLRLTATNQALGLYLRGYADLVMARTPQQALASLHKTQTDLLRHSAHTIAEAAKLWRKQNTELL